MRIAADQALCLSQIPKSLRQMPLEELKQTHKGNMNKALSSLMDKDLRKLESNTASELDAVLKVSPEDLKELTEENQSSFRAHLRLLLQTLDN